MTVDKRRIEDLDQAELVRFILDIIHRSILHPDEWFCAWRFTQKT